MQSCLELRTGAAEQKAKHQAELLELRKQIVEQKVNMEADHQELQARYTCLDTKYGVLKELCDKHASASHNVNNVTNNNSIVLCDLEAFNPLQLADQVTRDDLCEGAAALGRRVRYFRQDGKPLYEVADHSRKKFKIQCSGKKQPDDNAIVLKEKVRQPLKQGVDRVHKEVLKDPKYDDQMVNEKAAKCYLALGAGVKEIINSFRV